MGEAGGQFLARLLRPSILAGDSNAGAVLRTLIATHPDPQQVFTAWRKCFTEATASSPIAADVRRRDYLAEYCRLYAEDWTPSWPI